MLRPTIVLAIASLTLGIFATGCSKSSEPEQKRAVSSPIDLSTAGTIRVQVNYEGPVPTPQQINMSSAPQCAEAHSNPVYDPSLLVKDGRLENVLVWIKKGFGDHVFPSPSQPVEIDQKGCMYEPHVAVAMVDQPVEFVNSDPEQHNVHGHPDVVRAWNFMMSRKGQQRKMTFDKPEIGIRVGCDIHPWMRGYLSIVDNPYYGVTPASGTVTLDKVPPGDYTIASWHETLGTREQSLKLEPRGTASLQFTYKAP